MATSTEVEKCSNIQEKLSISASYLNFRETVRTKFGTKTSRRSCDIFQDIAVVLIGLKPGFLFDYTAMDNPSTLVELCEHVVGTLIDVFSPKYDHLSDTSASSLSWTEIKTNYRICKIADDFFVLNVGRTVNYLNLIFSDDLKHGGDRTVIDISHSLQKPDFASLESLLKLKGMIDAVMKQLKNGKEHDSSVIELQVEEDWNITSLFGFLLGYPVVYWYESPDGRNGLSMVPLTVYKVYSMAEEELPLQDRDSSTNAVVRKRHVVFSFSMPADMKQKCQQLIEDWFTNVTENLRGCKFRSLFGDFVLSETETILPSVAL